MILIDTDEDNKAIYVEGSQGRVVDFSQRKVYPPRNLQSLLHHMPYSNFVECTDPSIERRVKELL